jgi:hypothetical protein
VLFRSPTTTKLTGKFTYISAPKNVAPGEKDVLISAEFQAFQAGKYYLEAGFLDKGLFSINAEKSLCDGSEQYAGQFVDLAVGQKVQIAFTPDAPAEEGDGRIGVGAYTGCLNAGGKEIVQSTSPVTISSNPEDLPLSTGKAVLWVVFIIAAIVSVMMLGTKFGWW